MGSRGEVHDRVDALERCPPIGVGSDLADTNGLDARAQCPVRLAERGANPPSFGNQARKQGAADEAGGARNEDLLWTHWGSGGTASRGDAIVGGKAQGAAGRIDA